EAVGEAAVPGRHRPLLVRQVGEFDLLLLGQRVLGGEQDEDGVEADRVPGRGSGGGAGVAAGSGEDVVEPAELDHGDQFVRGPAGVRGDAAFRGEAVDEAAEYGAVGGADPVAGRGG